MRKFAAQLALLSALSIPFCISHAGSAMAFSGTPLVQCSDDYSPRNPFRVVNTVEADISQPSYMVLKFDSHQGIYPFDGVVTVDWHNLSTNQDGHFQELKTSKGYSIAAVPTGAGTVALAVRFNNTLRGTLQRTLPTAQCNTTVDVIANESQYVVPANPTPPPAVLNKTVVVKP